MIFFLLLISTKVFSQIEVSIYDMAYSGGDLIPLGTPIEIPENGSVTINFYLEVVNPDGVTGSLKALKKTSNDNFPVEICQKTVFSGSTLDGLSCSMTLSDSEFESEGGRVYGEFENTGGIQYLSQFYNVVVVEDSAPDPECNLPQIINTATQNITADSARLDWPSINQAEGYQVSYRMTGEANWNTVSINSSFRDVNNLLPSTNYQWKVRSKCDNGVYADFSDIEEFITLAECPEELNKIQNVPNGAIDIDDSSNFLTASNIIFNGGLAEYDTGNTLRLVPGFHAKFGASFRGYIEGCSSKIQRLKRREENIDEYKITNQDSEENIVEEFVLYPNPFTDKFFVSNLKTNSVWMITNLSGKLLLEGKSDKESKQKITVNSLSKGVYLIKIINPNGKVYFKKIVKK